MLLKTIKKEKGDTQYTKYVFKEWDLIKKTCVIPSNSCMFFLGYFYFGHIFLSNHKIRYLTKSEEEKLFNAIDELYPHIKPIIICALQTGMRKSEIFNLQWANINYDYNYIELLETKSGKARKIPISDKLNKVFSKQSKNYNYVFTNLDTGLPYKDIHKSFNAVLKKANIKNFRFHDLRHTVATRLVEQGVPLPVVQEILGHSKIETTMRYAHAIPEQKINAINLLSNYC